MSALYKCPYINRASEHSFNEGFCASTCIGQIGFATTCKDYEQLRVGEGDRRCEVRQTFNCFLIGVPAIYNDGYWWASDVWTNSGEPYNATCGSRSFKRPCVLQRQTRIVQCRDFMTQVVITEDRCPQMMSGDQNLLKPLDFRSIEIP
jgi:hypothetical protein